MDWIDPRGPRCLRITSPEARFWSKRSQRSLYKGSHEWFSSGTAPLLRQNEEFIETDGGKMDPYNRDSLRCQPQLEKGSGLIKKQQKRYISRGPHLQCTIMGRFPDCCCCLCTAAMMSIIPLPSPGIPISGHPWKWKCRTCCDCFSWRGAEIGFGGGLKY